jgi:hypothetical protein
MRSNSGAGLSPRAAVTVALHPRDPVRQCRCGDPGAQLRDDDPPGEELATGLDEAAVRDPSGLRS